MGLFLFNSRKGFKLDSVIALSCPVLLSPFGLEKFFPLPLAVMTLNISGQFWGRRSVSCLGLYLLLIRFGLCVSGRRVPGDVRLVHPVRMAAFRTVASTAWERRCLPGFSTGSHPSPLCHEGVIWGDIQGLCRYPFLSTFSFLL